MGSKFLEKKVKDLAAKKSNKECFDCGKKGVQGNVNLTHFTFICTRCAGLHRSLGHVAKSIGMHNFTKEQYDGLESGGNKKAHRVWMGKLPEEFKRPDQNEAKMAEFMKWVYIEKKFIKKDGDVKSAQKKKVVPKPQTTTKKPEVAGSQVPVASPASSENVSSFSSRSEPSHSQDAEDGDSNENESGGVDLLTDFEITEVPAKTVQGDKGAQQSIQNDDDGFDEPPTSLGNSSERDILGTSSRSQGSGVNRGVVDKLIFVLRNVKAEFSLSNSDLESAVEEALRQISTIVPSQSASSIDSGEDEGNPFEDEEEQQPQRTSTPQVTATPSVRPTPKPSTTSTPSTSLFPDLLAESPAPTPLSFPQASHSQPQQHHQQPYHPQYQPQQGSYQQQPQAGYGKPPVPQGGFSYGQPYSYGSGFPGGSGGGFPSGPSGGGGFPSGPSGGFPGGPSGGFPGGTVGPYGSHPSGPGFQPMGGFQNGYGLQGQQQQQPQVQAPKGPDLFAGLDPFA